MNHVFSREVEESISYGREEALRLGSRSIGPEHLLLGLLRQGDNAAFYMLKCRPVDMKALKEDLERTAGARGWEKDAAGDQAALRRAATRGMSSPAQMSLTRAAEKVIRNSVDIAESFTSREIEPEYLMLSLLKEDETPTAPILRRMGVDYNGFLKELV